jgi:AAA15 family ATPase/GTPase
MKINWIELNWFRGAAESAVLQTDLKSVVVYGPNASGKSTFVDGMEYVIRNGVIEHLAHEYSGVYQEKGVRNTKAPDDKISRSIIHFEDNSSIMTEIQPSGSFIILSDPTGIKETVQNWDVKTHILRQDEVARFIHCTKGEKYSTLLPLLGLSELEQAAENIRQIRLRVVVASDIEQRKGRIQQLTLEGSQYFPSLEQPEVWKKLNKIAQKYKLKKPEKEMKLLAEQLTKKIESLVNSLQPEQTKHVILEQILHENLMQKFDVMVSAEDAARKQFDTALDLRISVLDSTERFVSSITEPEKEIECPACGQTVLGSKFVEHVKEELTRLREAREARNIAKEKRLQLASAIRNILERCKDPPFKLWLDSVEQEELTSSIDQLSRMPIPESNFAWETGNVVAARQILPKIVSLIEKEAEKTSPSTKELVEDLELVKVCARITEMYGMQKDVNQVTTLLDGLQEGEKLVRAEIREKTKQILADISKGVKLFWSEIHPHEPIGNVSLCAHSDQDKAIDISLNFFGTEQESPRLTLSEGYRNSLGLCIFLSLAKSDPSSDPIVLDDIVSSLDREHRGMLAELILNNFEDRQIILFTHDREWYTELRYRLPEDKWKFLALRPWEKPEMGLRWSNSVYTFDDARALIDANPEASGNRVRAIMDTHMSIIAEKLEIQMPFLRGEKNDHRMCVDFLEKIVRDAPKRLRKKEGSQWLPYTKPIADWKKAKTLLVAWGDRASHTGSLTRSEVEKLIGVCEKALALFRCDLCGKHVWAAKQSSNDTHQCTCGNLQWREN